MKGLIPQSMSPICYSLVPWSLDSAGAIWFLIGASLLVWWVQLWQYWSFCGPYGFYISGTGNASWTNSWMSERVNDSVGSISRKPTPEQSHPPCSCYWCEAGGSLVHSLCCPSGIHNSSRDQSLSHRNAAVKNAIQFLPVKNAVQFLSTVSFTFWLLGISQLYHPSLQSQRLLNVALKNWTLGCWDKMKSLIFF